jgi:glycosyltransferase involved in cell wall biosynthesis
MASGCAVIAHSNPFNRWVLGEQGEYFSNITELAALLSRTEPVPDRRAALNERLERDFDWDSIADRYLEVLKSARPKT